MGISAWVVIAPPFFVGVALEFAGHGRGGLALASSCLMGFSLCVVLYELGRGLQVRAAIRRFKAGQGPVDRPESGSGA
jgi:hypothetical protein